MWCIVCRKEMAISIAKIENREFERVLSGWAIVHNGTCCTCSVVLFSDLRVLDRKTVHLGLTLNEIWWHNAAVFIFFLPLTYYWPPLFVLSQRQRWQHHKAEPQKLFKQIDRQNWWHKKWFCQLYHTKIKIYFLNLFLKILNEV